MQWTPVLSNMESKRGADRRLAPQLGGGILPAPVAVANDQADLLASELNDTFPDSTWVIEQNVLGGIRVTLFFDSANVF